MTEIVETKNTWTGKDVFGLVVGMVMMGFALGYFIGVLVSREQLTLRCEKCGTKIVVSEYTQTVNEKKER